METSNAAAGTRARHGPPRRRTLLLGETFFGRRRPQGLSTSPPRRRRDSSPRTIHVPAAAPRPASTEYPRYRRALLQLIERGGRAAADGDALVAEVLKENPSPYDTTGHGYLVGRELQGLAKVRFELHRELCRVTVLGPWVGALAPSARRAAVGLARECHKP